MMIFVNEVMKSESRPRQILEPFVLLLSPVRPAYRRGALDRLGHGSTLAYEPWPVYDPAMLRRSEVEIVAQVNGKVRSRLNVPADTPEETLEELARRRCGRPEAHGGEEGGQSHRREKQTRQFRGEMSHGEGQRRPRDVERGEKHRTVSEQRPLGR